MMKVSTGRGSAGEGGSVPKERFDVYLSSWVQHHRI